MPPSVVSTASDPIGCDMSVVSVALLRTVSTSGPTSLVGVDSSPTTLSTVRSAGSPNIAFEGPCASCSLRSRAHFRIKSAFSASTTRDADFLSSALNVAWNLLASRTGTTWCWKSRRTVAGRTKSSPSRNHPISSMVSEATSTTKRGASFALLARRVRNFSSEACSTTFLTIFSSRSSDSGVPSFASCRKRRSRVLNSCTPRLEEYPVL
mmetsp:Transcript_51537/g.137551  ORF Transcript_51537/g.137551 Transcript_51537/m.137551 type:complete len:209 (+) Transcript_51537:771-1397(+)